MNIIHYLARVLNIGAGAGGGGCLVPPIFVIQASILTIISRSSITGPTIYSETWLVGEVEVN